MDFLGDNPNLPYVCPFRECGAQVGEGQLCVPECPSWKGWTVVGAPPARGKG